jgi:hypothetical protein
VPPRDVYWILAYALVRSALLNGRIDHALHRSASPRRNRLTRLCAPAFEYGWQFIKRVEPYASHSGLPPVCVHMPPRSTAHEHGEHARVPSGERGVVHAITDMRDLRWRDL